MSTAVELVELKLPVFEALAEENSAVAERHLGLAIPSDFAEATDIWQFMVRLLKGHPENHSWGMRAVVVDGDEIVGNAGFIGAPADGQVQLGYRILPLHRRQGYAAAAVRLLLRRADDEPTVERVIARIAPDNVASLAVVAATGFVPDGEWEHPVRGRRLQFAAITDGRRER